MAAISWPAALPAYPMLAGASQKVESGIIRTSMDNGLARQRKRAGTPTSRLPVAWSMNGFQVALMKAWVLERAASGGAWFNIDLILDADARNVEARFVADQQYRLQVNGPSPGLERWLVSSEIEIKDQPLTFEAAELLIYPGLAELQGMDAALVAPYLAPAFTTWDGFYGV